MPTPSTLNPRPSLTLQLVSSTLPVLRIIQNASAASFSVFAIVHISGPLSALLPSRPQYLTSAENRANGFLLLGREYYQGEWSEPVLVWGSLTAHVLSGIARRWLEVLQRIERRKLKRDEVRQKTRELTAASELPGLAKASEGEKELVMDEVDELEAELVGTTTADEELVVPASSTEATPLFPIPNVHQRTGYLLIPFVAHHVWIHRLLPSSPFPPISSLSPAFFNYSFTSLALNHHSLFLRLTSALTYAGVAGLAAYHGLVGWRILLDPTAPRSLAPKRRRAGEKASLRRRITKGREWQAAFVALIAGLGIGTARIAGHLGGERTVRMPEWIARRMDLVLRKGYGLA
ncbi:hypothetical protein JCM5296_001274 [Sporobolomyces johnsonii]